jgi:hypothetical protein
MAGESEVPVSPITRPGIAALIRYLLVNLHEISGVEKGSWIRQPPFRAVQSDRLMVPA